MRSAPTSPTIKILGEIRDRPTHRQPHTRAAHRSAEVSARLIASGRCSSALQPLVASHEALIKAEHAGAVAHDLFDARADVNAVERAFADRCVLKTRH
jgi:hypothetical protein